MTHTLHIEHFMTKRGDRLRDPKDIASGQVYIYVQAADESFIPIYLEPKRWKDWYEQNKDSYIAKQVEETVDKIIESKSKDVEGSSLWQDFYNLLVFSAGDRIIKKNGYIIKYNSLEH